MASDIKSSASIMPYYAPLYPPPPTIVMPPPTIVMPPPPMSVLDLEPSIHDQRQYSPYRRPVSPELPIHNPYKQIYDNDIIPPNMVVPKWHFISPKKELSPAAKHR